MTDKSFYIILSSQTADFRLSLPQPIQLRGPYEVALLEFSFSLTWPNVNETEFFILPQPPAESNVPIPTAVQVTLPKGFYQDAGTWLTECHNAIPIGYKQYFTIVKSVPTSGYYEISIGRSDAKANGGIRVSDYVKRLLQLPSNEIRQTTKGYANLNVDKNFLIIEADFVDPQYFNDSARPFLSISHLNFIQFNYGSVIQKQIVTPLFLPVNRQTLFNLNLEMKFSSNEKPHFQAGWNHVVLCFRPKKL